MQGPSKKRKSKPVYVRGPEQLDQPDAFKELSGDEFPHRKSLMEVDRRSVLKLMGAGMALAGLSGCRSLVLPGRKIVPFVRQPEDAVSGTTTAYATVYNVSGYGIGVLATTHDGRPTKLDGNPNHPSSVGGLDSQTQAQMVSLYDPDRLQLPMYKGEQTSWSDSLAALRKALEDSKNGTGVYVLTETVGSPLLAAQLQDFIKVYPAATWVQWEPANRDNIREGLKTAYGQDVHHVYDLAKADVIVSLDADFLYGMLGSVRNARDVMARRKPGHPDGYNRIFAFESARTTAGVVADHRARVKASAIPRLAGLLASRLGVQGVTVGEASGVDQKIIDAAVSDLNAHRGRSVVLVGDHQPPAVHALAAVINDHLGNMGSTVKAVEPVLARPTNQQAEFQMLADAMKSGDVKVLFILGGNPAYSSYADVDFAGLLKNVPLSVTLASHADETANECTWALPASHFLEAWGDARAHDGTVSVQQPLIEPLYDTKSDVELLDALIGRSRSGHEMVEEAYRGPLAKDVAGRRAQDLKMREILAEGVVKGTEAKPATVAIVPGVAGALTLAPASDGIDLVYLPDPSVHDGRYANNGWLQELPKPISNLTWDNALYVSHATAKKLNVGQPQTRIGLPFYGAADMVEVTVDGRKLEVPVWVNLGQADDVVLLHLGYGRTAGGDVLRSGDFYHGGGFDANKLRSSKNPWIANQVTIKPTGRGYELANTQFHNTIDASIADAYRDVIYETTPALLASGNPFNEPEPATPKEKEKQEEEDEIRRTGKRDSLYDEKEFDFSKTQYQWALTIDLSMCTGCNACVTACQSENNSPVVGKHEVQKHREMQWIRIDRYFKGHWKDGDQGEVVDHDNPPTYFQPLTCMQCENAPCEPVCPVAATVHSHEGLNQMVYNRCVGTRYCSNNCPYKVRRFNFLYYTVHTHEIPVLALLQNPDVTVRTRGVMEKCTYCVQRINAARINAKKEDRQIRDGEIVTACQQACPAKAIVFGDKRDPNSLVGQSRADKRNYVLLPEVNTRPRTSYLARVHNPHPDLETR